MKTYHSHILRFPNSQPFNRDDSRWWGFVGEFVRPLMSGRDDLYWCSYYGSYARFRLYTDNYSKIEPQIDSLCQSLGLRRDGSEMNLTIEDDLGHPRFFDPSSKSTSPKRAELALRYLHSISELLVDSVDQGSDGYWSLEANTNAEKPNAQKSILRNSPLA